MNIYNRSSVLEACKKYKNAKLALEIWYEEVLERKWKTPNQIKQEYRGNVSVLKNSRVVFNIKGNDYRLVAEINYENAWVFIKFIGTHLEYDKIDANTINLYKAKPKVKVKPKKLKKQKK